MAIKSKWVYARAADSVRIEVRDEITSYRLVVHGPGHRWHAEVCADYMEAIQSQLAHEAQLFAQGFVLEGFERPEPAPPVYTVRPASTH